jgi:hypothetical protein
MIEAWEGRVRGAGAMALSNRVPRAARESMKGEVDRSYP